MKICFVLGGLKSGGIGRVVSILANRLAKQYEDCEVHILTTCPPEENEIYKLDPIIKRDYLVEEYTSMKKILFRFTRRLRKYLKENNIDIVIGCGNIYYLPVLLASQCISKNICWEHSNVYNNNDNQGQTILRKLASRF